MKLFSPIARRWHRHGFGIQSPWAYEFVRDVLFERYRYYAFDTLQGTKADEQLFRIMNWLKPRHYIAASEPNSATQHLKAAYRPIKDENKTDFELYYFAADRIWEVKKAFQGGWINSHSCLIIEGIDTPEGASLWESLVTSTPVTTSFDLGSRGIAFFDPARQKQNYQL